MQAQTQIDTISQLHKSLELGNPLHPLISVFHQSQLKQQITQPVSFCFGLYFISLKDAASCTVKYGHTSYDFEDGTMTFLAPGQEVVIEEAEPVPDAQGWTIAFHPDLIKRSELSAKISDFTFFNYDNHEALHLSGRERKMVTDIALNIENECEMHIDAHTQSLICSNIELLLKYCTRFYERQFNVRSNLNCEHIDRFNRFLFDYYQSDKPLKQGLPSVQYCGQQLALSPYYLSDLLKQETGKNALEHIHLFVIKRAKQQMQETTKSITEIAFDLGFEYPQHFSKLFKAKVGISPRQFRSAPEDQYPH